MVDSMLPGGFKIRIALVISGSAPRWHLKIGKLFPAGQTRLTKRMTNGFCPVNLIKID